MLVSQIGEFGLIERFKKAIKTDSSVIEGSGDDCAVLAFNKSSYQLLTCDMIIEGVDFSVKEDPFLIGRKALAVAVSDIAACAGLPRDCLVSLAMPRNTSLSKIDKILKGMRHIANKYDISIVGGDLSRAKELSLNVSLLGVVEKKNLVLRRGAKAGDIIFVSGALGGSILGRHLKFTPRLEEARFLVKNFKINSMIDISDGLVQDLGHILKQSQVGAVIYEDLIPVSPDARSLNDALYMGEDFELLFTLSRKEAEKILRRKSRFFPIGEVTAKKSGLRMVDKKAREKSIVPGGFRHF